MITRYLTSLFLGSVLLLNGQDTVFVNTHHFRSGVRNVFKANDVIYVKTGSGLVKLEEGKWVHVNAKFSKPYVFFDTDFFEADYIPQAYNFDITSVRKLIPQHSLANATGARLHNQLFVCVGGSLFEYRINSHYKHTYNGISIRDVYIDDSLKVVSTYSGIFINDTLRAEEPTYSNGEFVKIKGEYYLCNDVLYHLSGAANFEKLPIDFYRANGHIRKLILYGDQVFSQNTFTINLLEGEKFTILHQGFEYLDIELVNNSLMFCTSTGEVFRYSNGVDTLLMDLNTRIRDIYSINNITFLAADNGVYTFESDKPNTLKKLVELPNVVGTISDEHNNIWLATENGLYLLIPQSAEPIPFIPNVEFNRGALACLNDRIFVGAVDGLYTIDIYEVMKSFLPNHLNKKTIQEFPMMTIASICLVAVVVGYFWMRARKKIIELPQSTPPSRTFTLEQIKTDIKANNIVTVEGLADFYKTNTVQLNRVFKNFDSTPGKFLQKVKLEIAKEMLQLKVPIDEVSLKTGYSAQYLRKKLS